jgi:hypothetical protein
MFETHQEYEVIMPGVFGGDEGNQVWERVSTRLHMLWFYVTCLPTDKEMDQIAKILLISDIEGLVDLQKDNSATIREVYVVSPSHLNSSNAWKMDLLDHVLTGIEPMHDFEEETGIEQMSDFQQHAYIYVLKSGQWLLDSNLETKEAELTDIQILCQI